MKEKRAPGRRLARAFYDRDALVVAPELLNALFVVGDLVGRIVEVEVYRGSSDAASHAYSGRTARNATMFGPPGHLYVYFTYGMHYCSNVVCGGEDSASAVLLRALRPLRGLEEMAARRHRARRAEDLCSGPAKLCQALGITSSLDGVDLAGGAGGVTIRRDDVPPPVAPLIGPRIGLSSKAGGDRLLPWRFAVPEEPCVSKRSGFSIVDSRVQA